MCSGGDIGEGEVRGLCVCLGGGGVDPASKVGSASKNGPSYHKYKSPKQFVNRILGE